MFFKAPAKILRFLFFSLLLLLSSSCQDSSSADIDDDDYAVVNCKSLTGGSSDTVCDTIKDYLPLDDSEYPYAGIPRIVIETENHREIRDRETEIPAKLQIWGERVPESEVMELTIKGRGNTSWTDMPKKSYKIEFSKKRNILGMPQDKDWALIANYADKTLLKNYMTYSLAQKLGAKYSPRCEFTELYVNKQYQGVYLFVESIKKGKYRVNISKEGLLAEFDNKQKIDDIGFSTKKGKKVTIHFPKSSSSQQIHEFQSFIDSIDYILAYKNIDSLSLGKMIDINEYIMYYWIQEFSKNKDGAFYTSVYFYWEKNLPISMGPIWDFDLAYGGNFGGDVIANGEWYVRNHYWNRRLFSENFFVDLAINYWKENRIIFENSIDSILVYKEKLKISAKNNFKRWNILTDTSNIWHNIAFSSYEAAVDSLVGWINYRMKWIDENISSIHFR